VGTTVEELEERFATFPSVGITTQTPLCGSGRRFRGRNTVPESAALIALGDLIPSSTPAPTPAPAPALALAVAFQDDLLWLAVGELYDECVGPVRVSRRRELGG
jgi:hypothetical protein